MIGQQPRLGSASTEYSLTKCTKLDVCVSAFDLRKKVCEYDWRSPEPTAQTELCEHLPNGSLDSDEIPHQGARVSQCA